jgi:ankyrin repeat protein
MQGMHVDGTLEEAAAILARHPELAQKDIFTAAILGDGETIASILKRNPKLAKRKGGPYKWDPLTYLCFSRYLRLDASKSEGFTNAARVLLEAGANPNSGFFERSHQPSPEWESVLYGAAGLAHHPGVTKLLLDFGGDPNDNETPYHVPETYDNGATKVLIESGKLNENSLTTILLRKADWHDYEGAKLLLENGADPNRMTQWHHSAFQHAIKRDNALANINLMLDHGADPTLRNRADGRTGVMMAARRGRKDVLESIEMRGFSIQLEGVEGLILACAVNDTEKIKRGEAGDVKVLVAQGGALLAEFSGNGNAQGVRNLLKLGIPVDARYSGDGYFGIAHLSTALHVAAWKAYPEAVKALIEAGADVNAIDMKGESPLILAVRACVDSYWTRRRSPDSVKALLDAGARVAGVKYPCGYDEVDELLAKKID